MKNALIGIFASVALVSIYAFAVESDDAHCAIAFSTTDAGVTHFGNTVQVDAGTLADGGVIDGGTTVVDAGCGWGNGSTVLMQCNADVFFATDGDRATSSEFSVSFTNNSDPYVVKLGRTARSISVLGVSDAGVCKFAASPRRGPW